MKLRFAFAAGALVAIAFACSNYDSDPDAPPPPPPQDAGLDVFDSGPTGEDSGPEEPPDGGPSPLEAGSVLWALAIDAHLANFAAHTGAAALPGDGFVFAVPTGGVTTIDGTALEPDVLALGFVSATNQLRLASHRPRAFDRLAADSDGNLYVLGEYVNAASTVLPLVDGGTTTLPGATAGRNVYVAKVEGASGKLLWSFAIETADPDGGSAGITPRSIATRGQDVVIALTHTQAIKMPFYTGATLTAATADGNETESLIALVAPATPGVLWTKRIGGRNAQIITHVIFDENGDIWTTGYSNGNPVEISGEGGMDFSSGYAFGQPFIVKLAGSAPGHEPLFARSLALRGPGTSSAVGNAVLPIGAGSYIVCGRYIAASTIDGVPIPAFNQDDGFVARYDADASAPAWVHAYGGSVGDECFAAAARGEDVVLGINRASSNVRIADAALPDPVVAQGMTAALVLLRTDGGVDWIADHRAERSEVRQVGFTTGGDVFAAGFFRGPSLDVGGTVLTSENPAQTKGFVVRRKR